MIVIDDPLKADEALSDAQRKSVNEWYDNTLRSRLNKQEEGAIIIIMQRLNADDLVAHVQETEPWTVLSFSAIAEEMNPMRFEVRAKALDFIERKEKFFSPP